MVDDQKEREDIEKATDAKSLVSMQGASRNLTLVRQDNRILENCSKRKTRVPAFFLLQRERLVQEFSASHNEAPRRDKNPGDHVLRCMAFWECNLPTGGFVMHLPPINVSIPDQSDLPPSQQGLPW